MDNYLIAEQLIVERLTTRLRGVKKVLAAADLAGVAESSQTTPAVHVVYQGYRPTQEKEDGATQQTEQTWLVVVAVRNVRDTRAATATREDAGPIMLDCLRALQGWLPSKEHSRLKLSTAPQAGYRAGFGYFPMAFTTKLITRGDDT